MVVWIANSGVLEKDRILEKVEFVHVCLLHQIVNSAFQHMLAPILEFSRATMNPTLIPQTFISYVFRRLFFSRQINASLRVRRNLRVIGQRLLECLFRNWLNHFILENLCQNTESRSFNCVTYISLVCLTSIPNLTCCSNLRAWDCSKKVS